VLTSIAVFGVVGMAQADMCSLQGPGVEQCSLQSNAPPNQFTLSQFNAQLGALQSVELTVDVAEVTGTASFDFECSPGFMGVCSNLFVDVVYGVSFSGEGFNSASLGAGGGPVFLDGYCCTVGPQSEQWIDFPENGFGEVSFQDYSGAQTAPFIGNGRLTFNMIGTAEDYDDDNGNPGQPNLDGASASVDGVSYNAMVEYDFTPAVAPEPSFFFITGAALLGLVAMRFRRRSA
jgi:hypothetical protein